MSARSPVTRDVMSSTMSHRYQPRGVTLRSCVALALVPLLPVASADVLYVDRLDDDPTATACEFLSLNDCSLRGAVIHANGNGVVDDIHLAIPGTYTLTVAGSGGAEEGDLDVEERLVIHGRTPDTSIIDASGIPGGDRVLDVAFDVYLTVLDTTIQGGSSTGPGEAYGGGGIRAKQASTLTPERSVVKNNTSWDGGDIYVNSDGTLNVTRSRISNNSASGGGGLFAGINTAVTLTDSTVGPFNFASLDGGGLLTAGTLTLNRSTVWGNSADRSGGGIANSGTLEVTSSTVALNFAPHGYGGGLLASGGGPTATLTHVTLSGNLDQDGTSSAVYAGSGLQLANTLVEGTCGGGGATSVRGNLESPGDTCSLDGPQDQPGVQDPLIGDLAYNGKLTMSHPLQPGSPAIDAAYVFECVATDQRQHPRFNDGDGDGQPGCDIGAFEYHPEELFLDGFERGSTYDWSDSTGR